MVQQGWAVAYREYSKQYIGLEEEVEREGRGVWSGKFDIPAEWRRQQRGGGGGKSNSSGTANTLAPSSPLNDCTIKGNINSNGDKIYHVIDSPSYAVTINENKGERWFCSEDEAVAVVVEEEEQPPPPSLTIVSSNGSRVQLDVKLKCKQNLSISPSLYKHVCTHKLPPIM